MPKRWDLRTLVRSGHFLSGMVDFGKKMGVRLWWDFENLLLRMAGFEKHMGVRDLSNLSRILYLCQNGGICELWWYLQFFLSRMVGFGEKKRGYDFGGILKTHCPE